MRGMPLDETLTPGDPPAAAPARHPMWILAAVCLLALMSTVGVSLPYPILAPIFMEGPADGFTRFAGLAPSVLLGFALAANPLGILLGSMFLGPLSDRFGRRAVLSLSLTGALAGYLLTAAALAARNYPLFVFARLATGVSEGNVAIARALLADMHAQIDRVTSFAWLNAFLYGGWLVGPLIGGLTLPFGEPVPFVLAAAMMLPCLVVLTLGLPRSARSAGPLRLGRLLRDENTLGLLRDPVLALVFWLQIAYTLGVNAFYEYEPLWMLQVAGLGSRGIGLVVAAQCAAMVAASVVAGRLLRLLPGLHPLQRLAAIAAAAAAGFGLLAVLPAVPGLVVIVALGLPTALYNAVLPAWMSERFATHGQGRVMGLMQTIFCVANVLIAVAGGWIALLSTRWIMGLGAAAAMVAAVLMLRLARRERERPAS
jgi:MFS family permease